MTRSRHAVVLAFWFALVLAGVARAGDLDVELLGRYIKKGPLPPPRTGEQTALPFPPSATPLTAAKRPGAKPPGLPTAPRGKPLSVVLYQPEGPEQTPPQISVTFNQPMVALTTVGALRGSSPVRIEPPIVGEWKWLGSSTSALTPKARIPYATRYRVTVPAGTRSADGGTLAKAHVFSFDTPLPALVQSQPSDQEGEVELNAPILLWFNQAVSAEKIAPFVALKDKAGRSVPLRAVPRAAWAADSRLRSYVEYSNAGSLAVFVPKISLEPATSYELALGAGLVADEGPLPMAGRHAVRFATYPPMAVRSLECACDQWRAERAPRCTVGERLCVTFNHELKLPRPEERVTVSPRPEAMKLRVENARVLIEGQFRADTTYEVRVAAGVKDGHGQALAKPWSARMPFVHQPTSIEPLVAEHALVEKNGQLALPLRLVNAEHLSIEAFLLPEDQVQAGLAVAERGHGAASIENLLQPLRRFRVAAWQVSPGLPADSSALYSLSLKRLVAEHGGGPYLLVVDGAARAVLAQLTDLGLTVRHDSEQMVVLATSIASGHPLPGVTLRLPQRPGKPPLSSTTGKDGVAVLRATPHDAHPGLSELFLSATLGRDRSFVRVSGYGDDQRSVSLNWGHPERQAYTRSFLYPDRDLYRPGETVHVHGIHRRYAGDQVDRLGLPGELSPVTWIARSSRNRELGRGTTPISAFGTFAFSFPLPAELDLGQVTFETSLGSLGVQVQEYRAPEFEVAVKLPPRQLFQDGTLEAAVSARYLFGAPMRGAQLSWSLFSDEARFAPAEHAEFHFGSAPPRWQDDERGWRHHGRERSNVLRSGSARLDAEGRYQLSTPIDLGGQHLDPVSLTLETQVTDLSRQVVAGRASALAHAVDRYVGLRLPQGVAEAKRPTPIELVLVDLEGKRVPGTSISLRAHKDTWTPEAAVDDEGNATTRTQPGGVDVGPCVVTSAGTVQSCSLSFPSGGTYLLEASTTDSQHRAVVTRSYIEVVGKDTLVRDTKARRLGLIFDRKQYQPGQVATVTLRAPFPDGIALLTEERRGLLGHHVVQIANYLGTAKIALREDEIPNLELGATAIQARGKDRPPAAWAIGSASLPIVRDHKALTVVVRPARQSARPGEQLAVEVTVTDAQHRPVAARVSLVGVDEAVLGMSDFATPDPLAFFHYLRDPGVTLAELLKLLVPEPRPSDARKSSPKRSMDDASKSAEMMAGPSERAPIVAGGRGSGGVAATRRLFLTTPLAAVLSTNARGQASFTLPLPDNLTRFRLMAVAADAADHFGSGQGAVSVAKPLQLRASLPRFGNTSDAFAAGVIIDNQGAQAGEAEVSLVTTGLELLGPPRSRIAIPAGESREVSFQVKAPQPGVASLRFAVRLGQESDALEVALPVWTPATTEAFATYGTTTGQISQPISVPKDVLPGYGGLSITLASTALNGLQDAARYLIEYPYGCAEQVSSRGMPVFVLGELIAQFGIGGPELLAVQKKHARVIIDKLVNGQNGNGAWGSWANRDEEGRADLTAYILLVLRRGQEAGFAVPEETVSRASSYLTEWVRRADAAVAKEPEWRRRYRYDISAMALYALGDWGQRHDELARQLYTHARELDLFAKAMLTAVFHRISPASTERAALLRELQNRAIQTPAAVRFVEQETEALQLLMHSSARTDAIALLALLEVDAQNELIPKVVRGLMDARINGRWDTTQANAFALHALTRYFRVYEAEPTAFSTAMWLGQGYLGESTFSARSMREEQLDVPMKVVQAAGASEVTLAKKGSGRLYYRIGLRYAPREVQLAPADEGITVSRSYEAVESPEDVVHAKDGSWQVRAGAYVRVRLQLVVQDRRHYVVVDDALPAGLELVNTAYKTAARGALAQAEDDGLRGGETSWSFNHRELRDERSLHFADQLDVGIHRISVLARATTRGSFIVPPTRSEEMYRPEVFGRSATDHMTIR